ncbi:hypothetical protein IKU74_07310 [bacterium]|nr:hypothetical protein [bacterium]
MAKRGLLKFEYAVTIVVVFAVLLLIIPVDIESTVQANFISRWNDKYQKLEYMFDVIDTHESDEILKSFKRAKNAEEREAILLNLIQPYLRLTKTKLPRRYNPKFMNGERISLTDRYYFEDMYVSDNGMIVGIKDIDSPDERAPKFRIMMDINGKLPPNIWGKDIFGVNIFSNGVEAFGSNLPMEKLKLDCSELGTGVGCSYYYKIGGGFDD